MFHGSLTKGMVAKVVLLHLKAFLFLINIPVHQNQYHLSQVTSYLKNVPIS